MADIDNYDQNAPAAVMMTVHSAKGLEFPVVFLAGMEEGVFPDSQTIGASDEEMEEERRLAYVAITRAQKELYILYCQSRMVFGRTEFHTVSRFVKEIPTETCRFEGGADYTFEAEEYPNGQKPKTASSDTDADNNRQHAPRDGKMRTYGGAYAYVKAHEAAEKRAKAEAAQIPSKPFAVGERITHPIFGSGTVLSVKPLSGDVLYEVMFDSVGTKKVMGNYAKMTRVQ